MWRVVMSIIKEVVTYFVYDYEFKSMRKKELIAIKGEKQ